MPESAFFRCCHRCWHSSEMPCPEVVACRTSGPLCHDDAACTARLAVAADPQAGRPRVRVGTGTCGLGAGRRAYAGRGARLAGCERRAGLRERSGLHRLLRGRAPGRCRAARAPAAGVAARHGRQGAGADGRGPARRGAVGGPAGPDPRRDARAVARRAVPGRTSVLCAADAVGAGQLRGHRPRLAGRVPGPRRLPRAVEGAADLDAAGSRERSRGERAARAWRRRLPDRAQVGLCPVGAGRAPLPDLQRRRGRPGRVHGSRRDRGRSAPPARGDGAGGLCHRRAEGLCLHPRRVPAGRAPAAHRDRRGQVVRAAGAQHPRQRLQPRHQGQDGRRRLRLRRRDGADPLHRGQARHAAAATAVPGGAGAVRQADGDQQRRDAGQRARHPRPRGRLVQRAGHREQQGHEGVRAVGSRGAHRPGGSGDGHLHPRHRLRRGRRHSRRQGLQGRADRRALGRMHSRVAPRHAGGLRLAAGRGRHDGLGRPGRDG